MKKISIAVIGVGAMGKHHARNLADLEGVNLCAVADLDEKRGKQIADKYHCRYYSDYRKLLLGEKIDAATIAVPTKYHFQVASDFLSAGKHILIEKPITDDSSKAEKLIKEAEKRKLILSVGHIERFNPAVIELKKYLRRRELGKIVCLSAKRVGLFPPKIKETNLIVDLAIHDIDIFTFLLDRLPDKVWALAGKALNSERNDYAEILLSYGSFIHGIIQVNWITPIKIRQLAITGTRGYLELDYISQKLKIYKSLTGHQFESFGEFLFKFSSPNIIEISTTSEEPLKKELASFVYCVRNKKKPVVDGKVGLSALLIAEKIIRSIGKEYE